MNIKYSVDTPHQFLTITLGDEHFAIEIAKVREVMDLPQITAVPRMPDYFVGVINLRGNILSVADLSRLVGIESTQLPEERCIVIVEIQSDENSFQMGIIADSVREVIFIDPDSIEPPPQVGLNLDADFVNGITGHDEGLIILLNIEYILSIGFRESSGD